MKRTQLIKLYALTVFHYNWCVDNFHGGIFSILIHFWRRKKKLFLVSYFSCDHIICKKKMFVDAQARADVRKKK